MLRRPLGREWSSRFFRLASLVGARQCVSLAGQEVGKIAFRIAFLRRRESFRSLQASWSRHNGSDESERIFNRASPAGADAFEISLDMMRRHLTEIERDLA